MKEVPIVCSGVALQVTITCCRAERWAARQLLDSSTIGLVTEE